MLRLLLVCGAGMSSSLLVLHTQKAADEMGIEAKVWAVPEMQAVEQVGKCDVCLIGPQIRFAIPRIKKILGDVPCEMVEMKAYGMMNGKAVLQQALKLVERNK